MQSLKSNALEPTRAELATLSRGRAIVRMLPIYGLPILTVILIAFFSILLPDSFPTAINARSILSDKAIIALLSLAAMVPMMAGRIDLTVGFGIVMWHILAISLQVQYGVPWPLACLLVIACAGLAGLINGMRSTRPTSGPSRSRRTGVARATARSCTGRKASRARAKSGRSSIM